MTSDSGYRVSQRGRTGNSFFSIVVFVYSLALFAFHLSLNNTSIQVCMYVCTENAFSLPPSELNHTPRHDKAPL